MSPQGGLVVFLLSILGLILMAIGMYNYLEQISKEAAGIFLLFIPFAILFGLGIYLGVRVLTKEN